VESSSSSATTSTSSKARAAFEKLTVEELIQYLKLDKKQSVFREQEIDGQALTKLSTQDLVSIGVPLGPAAKILDRVPPREYLAFLDSVPNERIVPAAIPPVQPANGLPEAYPPPGDAPPPYSN